MVTAWPEITENNNLLPKRKGKKYKSICNAEFVPKTTNLKEEKVFYFLIINIIIK